MMTAGSQPEPGAIQHVREPGERMPVARVRGGERPFHAFPGESFFDDFVGGDVVGVIVVDKIVLQHGPKDSQSGQGQQSADGQD